MYSDISLSSTNTKKRCFDDLSSEQHDVAGDCNPKHPVPLMSKLQRHMSEHINPFITQPQSVAYQEVVVTELDGVEMVCFLIMVFILFYFAIIDFY